MNSAPVVGMVFARGGSKGLPGKNLKMVGGKSLVSHSVHVGLDCPRIDRVLVSTDDEEIAEAAREAGAEVPFRRPPHLSRDDSPEWLAWRHALEFLEREEGVRPDLMVSLPPTAPLRTVGDVERCLDMALDERPDAVITVTPAHQHPAFNMVHLNDEGRAQLVSPPEKPLYNRQEAPSVYSITTVGYAIRPSFILAADHLFSGVVYAVEVPRERAIDIDDELDLEFARFLWRRREVTR